ncbi:hypothetical protein [Phnomibacter sp. MR]|uniref:hypothetical protein n=1 Tax=Phnomibacter sp. MR TaxID=3042318 RepID=UPI003A809651
MKSLITLILFLFISPCIVFSCSCLPEFSIEKSINKADLIFKGKVISIDTVSTIDSVTRGSIDAEGNEHAVLSQHQMIKVSFKIIQFIKGTERPTNYTVFTTYGCCNCGFMFSLNRTYVVYAIAYLAAIGDREIAKTEAEIKQRFVNPVKIYSTSSCTRTTDKFKEELKIIKSALRNLPSRSHTGGF